MRNSSPSPQPSLGDLAEQQESRPGVAQAIATYEAVAQAYFQAVAAAPQAVVASSYATTTNPR